MLLWYTYLFSRPIVVTAVDVTTFGWSIIYWKRKISHQKFSLCWKYLMEHEMIRFPILSWTQLKHPWKSPLEMATCFRWNRLVDDIERLAAFYISYSWKFHSINRDHMIREKKTKNETKYENDHKFKSPRSWVGCRPNRYSIQSAISFSHFFLSFHHCWYWFRPALIYIDMK